MGTLGKKALVVGFLVLVAAVAWGLRSGDPPADFTFINGTEPQSIDPAAITGQPEGRIAQALFEGLVNWDPKTLAPMPGVARSWTISPDQMTYTFTLRDDARWSDGVPVTAGDFVYSFRRLLDPETAAEYADQLWHVKNAEKFSGGGAALAVGDRVEIELHERPEDAFPFGPGKMLYGALLNKTDDQRFDVRIGDRTRQFQPGPANAELPAGIEGCKQVRFDFNEVAIRALDDHTLEITLAHPTAYFLDLLGFYPLSPVNRRCVETHGTPGWTRAENLVANGPYRLQFRRIRDRVRLVKSETYWNRDQVQLETIDALAVESLTTALNLYYTGKIDWVPGVPPAVTGELLRQGRADFHSGPYFSTYFFRVNTSRPPLDNPLVRRALHLAIDKQQIIDAVTQANERPAAGLVPPGVSGYEPLEGNTYDPAAARALLAEAGFPGGAGFPKIGILYNVSESHAAVAQLIQAQWRDNLGIDIGLEQEEWNSYLARVRRKDYWIVRAGWIGDYVDPHTFLSLFTTGNPKNQTGWGSAEYDALLTESNTIADRSERLKMLRRAESLLIEEAPILPVLYSVAKSLVRPYVRGFHANQLDVHPLDALSIDEAARRSGPAEPDR